MARGIDPMDVVATIRVTMEASSNRSRKFLCHSLRDQFGFDKWTPERKDHVTELFVIQGITVQPQLADAGLNDWIVLSMASPGPILPGRRSAAEWFEHVMSVQLRSEREVEMHFASPLFHGIGYTDDQEAAGFRFKMWVGGRQQVVEADLVYFADERRSPTDSEPLVLVEAKAPDQSVGAGMGQARSYSLWVMPAYYVTTNGDVLIVYDFQGARASDPAVLKVQRSELPERFEHLCRLLNPKAAAEARAAKREKIIRSPAEITQS